MRKFLSICRTLGATVRQLIVTGVRMHRVAATLTIALCLLGCSPTAERMVLLTGVDACYAGGQSPSYAGVLVPDPEYGTRIDGKGPLMWPLGYTASPLAGGQVAVLDGSGNVVATTGREYAISPAPHPGGEAGQLMDRIGAIAAPDCYPWDFVDCTASAEDPGMADAGCPLAPLYDVAAVKASFADECRNPSVFEGETCERIDVDGVRGDGVYLIVPTTGLHWHPERAQVVCEQIDSAHLDVDGEPLGYDIVIIEGKNNKRLAECTVDG
jgi:hypothetical protein